MVIVQLLGGLGNQMFQYALGRQLALLNNAELKLDTSILLNWNKGKHSVNRGFDLDIFNLSPTFAKRKETLEYHSDGASIMQKVIHKIRKQINGDSRTVEQYFHYNKEILLQKGAIYLAGTWQSYKYFQSVEKQIRTDFSFRLPLSVHAHELHKRIVNSNSVCLNVRRTDYVTVANTEQIMALISIDYFKAALQCMKDMIGNYEVFIFSDDMEWCKNNFTFIEDKVHYIGHDYAGEKFDNYLQLMSACKHFIIPNSTFAWWGAWLNNNAEKKVIVPLKWFNDISINTDDLIPEQWIRL